MVGLDTNVLVRLLTRDDAAQLRRAEALVRTRCRPDDPGWISLVVLCELVWVLEGAYGYAKADIARALEALLRMPSLQVEHEPLVAKAIRAWRGASFDFADAVIAVRNRNEGCVTTHTFDRKAAKQEGFSPVP